MRNEASHFTDLNKVKTKNKVIKKKENEENEESKNKKEQTTTSLL